MPKRSLVTCFTYWRSLIAGLHPHDVEQLCGAILQLRDRGNSVILVEHEETMIRLAEHVIEIGPEQASKAGKSSSKDLLTR